MHVEMSVSSGVSCTLVQILKGGDEKGVSEGGRMAALYHGGRIALDYKKLETRAACMSGYWAACM